MDETNRNSLKLDIEAVRLSDNDRDQPKESYKQVSEFDTNEKLIVKTANMARENGENHEDGADEKMLGAEDKAQLARKDEVKFISGDHTNGDAKIDIGHIEKAFTGMTKEELMKFANDPFWIRLRWIFFILFWLLWVAMLAGAILIIVKAPKCTAPVELKWSKLGPLVQLPSESTVEPAVIEKLKSIDAKGVIFQLPADKTYLVDTPEVQNYVKTLVNNFRNTSINVVLDLTPNFVTKEDELYRLALNDTKYRDAFVWVEGDAEPTKWRSLLGDSAWKQVKVQNWVLSQFDVNTFDLQLNNPIAKEKLKKVLRTLVDLGVKGFRLSNAKHYIIDTKNLKDEEVTGATNAVHNDYNYWNHVQTTFQPGLGQLLEELALTVHNATNGDGFLGVSDDLERPEAFENDEGRFGFDLPIHTVLTHTLTTSGAGVASQLYTELNLAVNNLGAKTWAQWVYNGTADTWATGLSEYNIFLCLLPGVPVGTVDHFVSSNESDKKNIALLEEIRKGPSFQHGNFDVYLDANRTVVGYTRIKSGNPGYFVVFNPSSVEVKSDFSGVHSFPEQLTVYHTSGNFNITGVAVKSKVNVNEIVLSPRSAVILTYVPKKD